MNGALIRDAVLARLVRLPWAEVPVAVKHRSEDGTALLGMPGFVVGAHLEVDGDIWGSTR